MLTDLYKPRAYIQEFTVCQTFYIFLGLFILNKLVCAYLRDVCDVFSTMQLEDVPIMSICHIMSYYFEGVLAKDDTNRINVQHNT